MQFTKVSLDKKAYDKLTVLARKSGPTRSEYVRRQILHLEHKIAATS